MFLSVGEDLKQESFGRLQSLISSEIASRIFEQDSSIWGSEAEEEAKIRLGWTRPIERANELLPEIVKLREELNAQGITRIVLCGMGGSSLAPEVICKSDDVDLVVLDSTSPTMVREALTNLQSTAVVVASKSGSTVETDSQKRAFEGAFEEAGIDPRSRIVIVTDPGSPLMQDSEKKGYTIFEADPNVGGRYSALTAFGLVPSGLAGANIAKLIASAKSVIPALAENNLDNPGLLLAAAISGKKSRMIINDSGTQLDGFADWAEQLIAESTGKLGKGILPVVGNPSAEIKAQAEDIVPSTISKNSAKDSWVHFDGSLGELFMVFELATAAAGWLLEINPFDQPDVESAKKAARESLTANTAVTHYSEMEQAREILSKVSAGGYLSVQIYAARRNDDRLTGLRERLVMACGSPVTIGWGPRFLHSTGQFHKGGTPGGVFIQIVQDDQEQAIPGKEFGFQELIEAQANGDANVLRQNGSPVVSIKVPMEMDPINVLEQLVD